MDALRQEKINLIEQELARRQSLSSAEPDSRQQRIEAISAELARRGVQPEATQQPKEELSFLDKAMQIPRGLAKGMAAYSEALGPGGQSLYAPEYSGEPERSNPEEAAHLAGEAVNRLYGKNLEPTTDTGKMREGIGEFLTPMPIPAGGIGAATGVKGLAKYLGKQAAMATGASATVNLTPQIADEGTGAAAAEHIAKAAIGAKAGHGLPGAARTLGQSAIHPVNVGVAKLASRFIAPEPQMLEKAARHGIELPFNVGSNRIIPNHVANNVLKTIYASEKYDKSLERSGKSLIESVKKPLSEELGDLNLQPHEASSRVKDYLKEQELAFKRKSDVMYEDARKSLKKVDNIVPKHTLKALESEPVNDLLNTLSPSASEKSVINRIKEVSDKLSAAKLPKEIANRYRKDPEMLKVVEKQLSKRKEVSVSDLINLRKSLLNTLNYETDIRGSEAFLSRLIKTIDSDIQSIPNKEALKKYEDANRFFAQNIGQRFRGKLGKSLMKKEDAKEAYLLTNSVKKTKALEKIIGEGPEGKKVLDSLKKARVHQILSSGIKGDLHGEGVLNTQSFANIFKSGKKSQNQELLRHLVGEKQYKNLSEVADIAEEFSKSKQVLINTSGTAHVASDLNLSKDILKETVKTLSWFSGLSAGGFGVAGPAGAIASAASPYLLSKLLANPKFVSQMRTYALVRKQGNEKYANTLLRPLLITVSSEIRKQKEEDRKD